MCEDVELNALKVFAGNLPFSASREEIEELFRKVGDVKGVNLRKDRQTGKLKGFGFITFAKEEEAEMAIANLNGRSFMGRELTVRRANNRGGDDSASKPYVTSSSPDAKSKGVKSWTEWSEPP